MKILVATDAHIYETPDGKHWTPAIYGYSFWTRYLEMFDNVRIVARTKKIDKPMDKFLNVDGEGVEIFPLPFYQGPWQLLKVYLKTHLLLRNVAEGCDVALFRMPSQTAQMVYQHVRGKLPIGGEIVYDPSDDLNDKNSSFLVNFLNKRISENLKSFCMNANGVSYVTERTIQEHYPSKARVSGESCKYFESFYSTITLHENAFTGPRDFLDKTSLVLCLSDVSMNSGRKGEETLIRAVKYAREREYDVSAVIIGDGSMRKKYEALCEELDVVEYVKFVGRFATAEQVREQLLNVDMYVFPTQAEGLPRGILEAMAVGLPVLSTPVGGIPEVISNRYLYLPNDYKSFAEKICDLLDNCHELNEMSECNYYKSREFSNEVLQKRRNDFYSKLINLSKRR